MLISDIQDTTENKKITLMKITKQIRVGKINVCIS